MIHKYFHEAIARSPERPFLLSPSQAHSYNDFFHYCRRLATGLSRHEGRRIALYMPDSAELIAALIAAGLSGKSVLLLSRELTEQRLPALLRRYDIDVLLSDKTPDVPLHADVLDVTRLDERAEGHVLEEFKAGEILVLTSGTTGEPKCARYTWNDLFAQVGERPAQMDERWLLAYRLNHFAGLQMLVHVLRNRGTLVLAESTRVAHALQAIRNHAVTHVSSTPTFWRYVLASLPASGHELSLKQITLGSEPVSASLLDRLRETFPDARIVHIYASTEAGSCVSVSDMRPGLPASILRRPGDASVQFRIQDEELHIRSKHGMRGYAGSDEHEARDGEGWLATGDLVRIEDDRILFVGRRSETINIGGVKVYPLEVENIVSAVPGVKLTRAFAQDNPVTGQIVAIDVVLQDGHARQVVEDAIRQASLGLSRHARPRCINFVDSIETNNLKLKRQ